MKKGQVMPNSSRQKMSATKQARITREDIGRRVVHLLLRRKTKEATRLANSNADLFLSKKL